MANLDGNRQIFFLLMRISAVAKKALYNINKGDPNDAIRLLQIVSKLDVAVLQKLEKLPYYGELQQPHQALVKACSAILALVKDEMLLVKKRRDHAKLIMILERIIALDSQAKNVEMALTSAERYVLQNSTADEKLIHDYWKKNIHDGFVYHGTSTIFLENIKRFGLTSEGIFSEGTPFSPEDYRICIEIGKKAGLSMKYFTNDVTQGFFITSYYNSAIGYAKDGPERVGFLRDIIKYILSGAKTGRIRGPGISEQEMEKLVQVLSKYDKILASHRPIVLHIPMVSFAFLNVLEQNGFEKIVKAITDYEFFKEGTLPRQQRMKNDSKISVQEFFLKYEMLRQKELGNLPLRGRIPPDCISKIEYV